MREIKVHQKKMYYQNLRLSFWYFHRPHCLVKYNLSGTNKNVMPIRFMGLNLHQSFMTAHKAKSIRETNTFGISDFSNLCIAKTETNPFYTEKGSFLCQTVSTAADSQIQRRSVKLDPESAAA